MAGIIRWNAKWDRLELDSDGEEPRPEKALDATTRRVLQCFPPATATAVAQEQCPFKRNLLLLLNCYLIEVNGKPKDVPDAHQQLLGSLCEALKARDHVESSADKDAVRWHVLEALGRSSVHPRHVEHSIGAMALLPSSLHDPVLVKFVLRATLARLRELAAGSLARVCWAAAVLTGYDPAREVLTAAAARLGSEPRPRLAAGDVAAFAWACAVARPEGAGEALGAVLETALPERGSEEARLTAWALESLGLDASPRFGRPPEAAPAALAGGLCSRLRELGRRDGSGLVHAQPPVLRVDGFASPGEARSLLGLAESRLASHAEADGEQPSRALLETLAGLHVPLVARLRQRAAELLGLPESHCEPPCVVRHRQGRQLDERSDFVAGTSADRGLLHLGGQRVATLLVYLATVPSDAGGQTLFPRLPAADSAVAGKALAWPVVQPTGREEEGTAHTVAAIASEQVTRHCLVLSFHAHPVAQTEAPRPALPVGRRRGPPVGPAAAPRTSVAEGLPALCVPPRPLAAAEHGPKAPAGGPRAELAGLGDEADEALLRASALELLRQTGAAVVESPAADCPPPPAASDPWDPYDIPEDSDCEESGDGLPAGTRSASPDMSTAKPFDSSTDVDAMLLEAGLAHVLPSRVEDFEEID